MSAEKGQHAVEAVPATQDVDTKVEAVAAPADTNQGQNVDEKTVGLVSDRPVDQPDAQVLQPGDGSADQEAGNTTDDEDEFPDGGRTAWLVVVGAWCVSFCSYGWINSVGTFQEYYQTGPLKEYSASEIAWIPAMQIFLMSALGPFAGRIFDSYGPRYLMLGGSFMHVFGLMMASLSSKYYQFLLSQGLCSAIGVSCIFLASIGSVSGWFKKRRGAAFGIFATGSSLGGVVFPFMLFHLIKTIGYGWAMRIAAFIIMSLLVVANLTVKCRKIGGRQPISREQLARPFHELTFVLLLVGLSLVPFGLYTPINFIPTVAKNDGMAEYLAQDLIAFYNAASLIGRAGSGFLADRFGLFNIFTIACYGAGVWIMGLWIPGAGNDGATIAFSLLFGLFSGAYIALLGALVARISPIEEVGYRNGVSQLFGAVGGLVTAPIAGAILESPAGAIGLKAFAGAFMIAGTTGILAARISKTGFKVMVNF